MLELVTLYGTRPGARTSGGVAGGRALVLGHGAGGGVESPDLIGAAVARSCGLSVALVEQPYRVAGRRSPAPASHLDAAWTSVVLDLREGPLSGLPILTVKNAPSGARVACRTAAETNSVAVVCLAFPLHPPGHPEKSRLPELDAVHVPTLVVRGESDPFGTPPPSLNLHRCPHPGHPLSKKQSCCCGRRIGLASDNLELAAQAR